MEATHAREQDGGANGQSLADLGRHLSEESSRLARLEIELAKAEITAKGKRVGIGAGVLGGAGVVALCALGALTAAAILGLATVVDGWIAALVVAALLGGLSASLALIGKDRIDAGTPPAPRRAIASSRQDIERAKQSVKEARR